MTTLKVGLGVFDDAQFRGLSSKAQATYWLLMVAMPRAGITKRAFDVLCGEGMGKVLPALEAAGLIELDGNLILNTGRVVQLEPVSTPRVQAKRQRDESKLLAAATPPARAPAPSAAPRAPSPIPASQAPNTPLNQPALSDDAFDDWGNDEADAMFRESEPTHGREPAIAAEFDELFAVDQPAPQEPKPKARKEKPAEPLVPEWLGSQRWSEWLEHRKEIKKPMTVRAQNLMLGELDTMKGNGIDVLAAMNKSIISGWAGVFAPAKGFATKADSQKNEAKRNGGLVL